MPFGFIDLDASSVHALLDEAANRDAAVQVAKALQLHARWMLISDIAVYILHVQGW